MPAATQTTTSGISAVVTGAGRNRTTTYTATRVTGPIGNPPTYQSEIIRYDDARGSNPTVIGNRNSSNGNITWNDNATGRIRRDSNHFARASTGQINSVQSSLATNAPQRAALNASAGRANQAQGSGNNAATAGTNSGSSTAAGQGQSLNAGAVGNSRNSFPGAGGNSPLVFPEALTSIDRDIIKFNMLEYRPSGFGGTGRGGFTQANIIGSCVLPVPAGIGDQNSVSWSDGNIDPVKMAMASATLTAIEKGLEEGAKDVGKSLKKAGENKDEVRQGLAAIIASGATDIGKQALQRGSGQVINPNMELLFNGPAMRSFSFSFKLSPRSTREAQTVVKIIKFFKQGMSPIRSESNYFLKAPHTFQLEYKQGGPNGRDHPYLNKFKECALQSCGVQYTPDGNYNTFTDGVMTSYLLTLSFGELEPIFNDDYGSGSFDASIGY